MHALGAGGKILSLKVLAQKGFESHILVDCICISKGKQTYTEAMLGGELYELKMKVVQTQENILSAVKRDTPATDLYTWHRRLGHLGDTKLKKLVGSKHVKGMEVTNIQLTGICGDCILGKMDERPYATRIERDPQVFGTLHADIIGTMSPEARWTHAKFSLIIHDNCSSFGFAFNLTTKDQTTKTIMDLDRAIENKFQR